MRPFAIIVTALGLVPAGLAAQDHAAFVVRIGRDTLALEEMTRTATQIRGQYVARAPRPVHALYTADLNSDGTIRRLELSPQHRGGPGPAETRGGRVRRDAPP
jgi:hypothetical protein